MYKQSKINIIFLLMVVFIILLINLSFGNTYSNNSIEIEVTPHKRSYNYGEKVGIEIRINNKNRYGKLHYKITDIYSGGGFEPIDLNKEEIVVDELLSSEINIELKDKYYKETKEKNIDTHITFNNGYFSKKGKMNIGKHAYEITEKEYEEFNKYRKEKIQVEKTSGRDKEHFDREKIEQVKSEINATILIIIIGILIMLILIIFIWFIIKSKGSGGSQYRTIVLIIGISIIINIINKTNSIYGADIYQENVKYNKTISTKVGYSMFDCTFDVKVEYYFVNTIAPITNLELDTDNDTLPDYLEVLYLTDLNDEDTDGDGLNDGIEVYRTYTDPLRIDTDNDGVKDGDEDFDNDGITNLEEKSYGTDCDNIDSDFDSLSDYDEINGVKSKDGLYTYHTNPLSEDTDGDGLRDETELKLGLNPTNPSDYNTKVEQKSDISSIPRNLGKESSIPILFYGNLIGDIDEKVKVRINNDFIFDEIGSIVGNPISIDTEYGYNDGLKIEFDISKYESIKDRLQLCRYDDGELKPVEHTYISNNKLLGDVYTGEYVLIDSKEYLNKLKIYIK